jgi:hypothetical protein
MNCKSHTFDPVLARAIRAAGHTFKDTTWGNDVCASALVAGCVRVFSDASDPAERELANARYFAAACDSEGTMIEFYDHLVVETDDRDAVLAAIETLRGLK